MIKNIPKRTSLAADFFLFSLLCFIVIMVVAVGFWLQVYDEARIKKQQELAEAALRLDSVITDTMDYITQYAAFVGDKIAENKKENNDRYIANLITGRGNASLGTHNFYFTTTFDWVTPDKKLRVSNKIGILPEPFDMSDRDYLARSALYPWTLQLSPPRLGGLSKQWILPAGMGITNRDGKYLGSITLGFALSGLEQRITKFLGKTDIKYILLTQDLKLTLKSDADDAYEKRPAFSLHADERLENLSSGYLQYPVSYDGDRFSYLHKLEKYPYIVLTGYREGMESRLLNELVISRSLSLLVIGLGVFLMLHLMRRRIITPIAQLARAADRIRRGERVIIPNSELLEISVLSGELQKISDYIHMEQRINEALNQKTIELKKATEDAVAARDAAVKADQAKSEFLANMSHELRTPLNAIIGLTQILIMRKFPQERLSEYIQTMHMCSQQLLKLINDLLDITKLDDHYVQLEHIAFDIGQLVQEVVKVHELPAKEKGLAIAAHITGEEPLRQLVGDPNRLRQVLVNLVSNAVKFTEQGSVTLQAELRPSDKPHHADLRLQVVDTGIGIAEEKRELIFDKFSQADSSITRKYGGSGLGLSISKKLIELMHGELAVESNFSQGSTFSVSLCLPLALAPQAGASAQTPDALPADAAQKPILIVEDNKNNMLVVSSLLDMFGYRYDWATNGQQAIEMLQGKSYAAVLMDIQMPEMDGLQATRIIRTQEAEQSRAQVPIIGMTAHALAQDREKCMSAGMNEYISKPFEPQRMLRMLQHFCEHPTEKFLG